MKKILLFALGLIFIACIGDDESGDENSFYQLRGFVTSDSLDLSQVKVGLFPTTDLWIVPGEHMIDKSFFSDNLSSEITPELTATISKSNDSTIFNMDLPKTLPLMEFPDDRILLAWIDLDNDGKLDVSPGVLEKNCRPYFIQDDGFIGTVSFVDYTDNNGFSTAWKILYYYNDSTVAPDPDGFDNAINKTLIVDENNYDKMFFPLDKPPVDY